MHKEACGHLRVLLSSCSTNSWLPAQQQPWASQLTFSKTFLPEFSQEPCQFLVVPGRWEVMHIPRKNSRLHCCGVCACCPSRRNPLMYQLRKVKFYFIANWDMASAGGKTWQLLSFSFHLPCLYELPLQLHQQMFKKYKMFREYTEKVRW